MPRKPNNFDTSSLSSEMLRKYSETGHLLTAIFTIYDVNVYLGDTIIRRVLKAISILKEFHVIHSDVNVGVS
jgi:hypothetical protein